MTRTGAEPLSADELLTRVVGRGAALSHVRRERPRLASSSLRAYRCESGNLRRICDTAAPDECFDGHGRGWTDDSAIVSAVFEALERYAACLAGAGSPIQFGAAEDFGDTAVAPERFPRLSEGERQELGIATPPADATSRIGWYEGHDLVSGRAALLPAQLVFLGYRIEGLEAQVQYATSKGLAAHWTDDAAILHGLCEVVEADAFTTTYLNRLPVPEIDLGTVRDGRLADLLAMSGAGEVESVRAWNLTNDCQIPTALVALRGSLHDGPVVTFGCATAPQPATAVEKAVQEAIHTTAWLDRPAVETVRRWTVDEIRQVRGRGGHKLLGTNPTYLDQLDWLFARREVVSIDDIPPVPGATPGAQLSAAVDRVSAAGISCYACHLTPPDLADSVGLRVWRVLAPEAHPFVLAPVRYLASRRLRDVAVVLGYRAQPLPETAYNHIPHPCP